MNNIGVMLCWDCIFFYDYDDDGKELKYDAINNIHVKYVPVPTLMYKIPCKGKVQQNFRIHLTMLKAPMIRIYLTMLKAPIIRRGVRNVR
jgi:hypothetical protein